MLYSLAWAVLAKNTVCAQVRAEVLDWAALGGPGARRYDVVLACDVLYEVQAAQPCLGAPV